MANEFYATSGSPATSSQGSSATMRSEFTAIAAGFDKLPVLAGNGSKLVQVNSGGSALTAVALTVGAILFGGAAGVLGQDGGNLFWDNTAKRLGIGNAAPSVALDVTGAIKTSTTLTASTSVVTPLLKSPAGSALTFGTTDLGTGWSISNSNLDLLPTADNSDSFGSPSFRIKQVFTPIIDSGTTGSLSLRTNNGTEQVRVFHLASAVNALGLQGNATGLGPFVLAFGTDTDIALNLQSKGAGNINFFADSGSTTQFQVLRTASSSRNITVTGSNGGNPTLGVTGGSLAITPAVVLGGALTMGGTLTMGANTLALATATVSGTPTWSSTQAMNISGSSASATGNAATATALQNARTINGVSFDGTANITLPTLQNSQSAAYTTVIADAEKHVLHPVADNNPRTFTIDSNANVAYQIGATLTFVNEINVLTIAITSDTMTLAGAGSTGSRSLAANGIATAIKIASTKWLISGVGLS